MESQYLGLERIEPSDYVSPETIDGNFQKIDVLGLDYITEVGTKGEWWYRRWKNGRLECGIDDKNFGDVTHVTSLSNFFVSEALNFGAYPFAFASRPFASISFQYAASVTHSSWVVYWPSESITTTPLFKFASVDSGTSKEVHFGIYVCGRYK